MKKTLIVIVLFTVGFLACKDGMDGKDGDIGPSGFVSLITTTMVNIGDENCPDGGTRIDTGIDNGDGEDGIAGNEILEPGEIDNTTYICNDPPNGELDFRLDLGAAGSDRYSGFQGATISDRFPNSNVLASAQSGFVTGLNMSVYVDKTVDPDSISRQRVLMKFANLSDTINSRLEPLQGAKIVEAILYVELNGIWSSLTVDSDIQFIEFGPVSFDGLIPGNLNNADSYVMEEVTWTEANTGNAWTIPGMLDDEDLESRDDRQISINDGVRSREWFAFRLDSRVNSWQFDEANNGLLLSLSEAFVIARGNQESLDASINDVLLHLVVDVSNEDTGGRSVDESPVLKPWDQRTEAEKFTPLYRYLNRQ